jgi:hypothetical protein
VNVSARIATAARVPLALVLAVAAGTARPASLSVESGVVILGRTESATVTVRVDEPPGAEERPLRLSVNVGSFSEPRRIGPGKYRATYLPPPTRFPQVALVAVWRETGPDARIDFLRMPLLGQTKLAVTARKGSQVKVEVGLDTFGPVVADARGSALVPILVPPGVAEARVTIKDPAGGTATKDVPVEVPPYNRLTAALVPHAILADGAAHARLDVHYELGGANLGADRVRVVPTVGAATLESAGKGLYVYRYVPPAGTSAKAVQFRVEVDGDPRAQATATLSLGLHPPARVLLRPPLAPVLAGSGTRATLGVLVLDAAGMGLPAQDVQATANGEPLGAAEYRGEGLYEIPFVAPATYPAGGVVRLEARVKGAPAPGVANWQLQAPAAPRSILARLSPSPVPADGRTEAALELDVRDASGMPLEGAQLLVAASDGTVGALKPVAKGRYRAAYVPPEVLPAEAATLRVVDTAGTFERSVPLPLRRAPGRLLLGVRAGFVQSLDDLSTARAGVDVLVPLRLGGVTLLPGATASLGTASQTVSDPASGLTVRSEATFVPVSLRLAAELWAGRRFSLSVGAGAVVAFARFENSAASGQATGTGFGGTAFAAAALASGPGQLFVEGSWSQVEVEADGNRLPAGGVGVEAGYRLRVF